MGSNATYAANIDNLTQLWKAMGVTTPPPEAPATLNISESWPHRCWLDLRARADELVHLANTVTALPQRGIVPVWPWPDGGVEALQSALAHHGFTERSALTAMVLPLDGVDAEWPQDEATELITTSDGIHTWTELCSQAFGYAIDETVTQRLGGVADLDFFLARVDGVAAATALTYKTGDTIGIHQVGVPKEFRGQGVAKRLMDHVMAHCRASGCRQVTLQASKAGAGIYRKIGFEDQFTIRNYQRVAG